jgi:hypothetical protein
MDFFHDGSVMTATKAGGVFRGTYAIADGSLCRDYGRNGGRKCYRVTRDGPNFAIVDSSNASLRFSIVGPASTSGTSLTPQALPNQRHAAGTPPAIASAFMTQIGSAQARKIKLRGATIVSSYALLSFSYTDIDSGGEALLSYDPSHGWKLVTHHGAGAWDPSMLVPFGVPASIAQQLIAGRDGR